MNSIEFTQEWKEKLLNRFLAYVKIYSTSDPEKPRLLRKDSGILPTTSLTNLKQLALKTFP